LWIVEASRLVDTSSVHASSKALLIAAVLALGACRDADVAVLVRLADEREPVAGVAQEERLHNTHTTGRSSAKCKQQSAKSRSILARITVVKTFFMFFLFFNLKKKFPDIYM